jgi:N5-(cytidine 5'-diphosphoramidyl)-L-glutamine hydrolase
MLVALTMRVTEATAYVERRDSISHDWLSRLDSWGMSPLLLPNKGSYLAILDRVRPDLLVLTGGDDPGVTPERDVAERELFHSAVASGTPVLGICRGLQLINQWMGGSLGKASGHVAVPHNVRIEALWGPFYGATAIVNSFHTSVIPPGGLAQGLSATAFDDAGNIEAFARADAPVAGVMWHPERADSPNGDRRMIESLVARKKT